VLDEAATVDNLTNTAYVYATPRNGSELSTADSSASVTINRQQTYALTVVNGSGSGNYAADSQVTIIADPPPPGMVFDRWVGADDDLFADASSPTTVFTMPGNEVTITATYKPDPTGPSGSSDADLTSVADNDTTDATGPGTPDEPKTGDITVPYEKDTITRDDIEVSDGATYIVYRDPDFTDEVTDDDDITLEPGSGTDVYIKVTSEDGSTVKYYRITVNREKPAIPTIVEDFGTFKGSGTKTGSVEGPLGDFVDLMLDGEVVDPANYTVVTDSDRPGYVEFILHEDYLKTLANGTYQFTAVFTDGEADLNLIVDVASVIKVPDPVPGKGSGTIRTGDLVGLTGVLVLTVLLTLAALSLIIWRKPQVRFLEIDSGKRKRN
jgi:hypothetical protein